MTKYILFCENGFCNICRRKPYFCKNAKNYKNPRINDGNE